MFALCASCHDCHGQLVAERARLASNRLFQSRRARLNVMEILEVGGCAIPPL